jgi:hypothetical protein
MDGLTILLVFAVLFISWLVWQIASAPEGWEDEDGFHRGEKK